MSETNTNVELEIMYMYFYFNELEILGTLCYFSKISF